MNKKLAVCVLSLTLLVSVLSSYANCANRSSADSAFSQHPWNDPNFFPIAVWLQSPANASRYRAAGINTYVGLWKGPTAEQLTELKKVGMHVICSQNEVGRKQSGDRTIIGWMHDDEPDNAQLLREEKGYGPPVPPSRIIESYERMRSVDQSRPVLLNLGQGVAWDGWYGRGVRTGHPEDYLEYITGCDVVSFDIYPAVHDRPEIAGNLWYVARGVERLVDWSKGQKIVWNCLECTRISNPARKPTPHEVRCEAWMSLIHGSQGLIYFVHQFKPEFREAALLDDPEMLSTVTALNKQITELAPVLKSRTSRGFEIQSSNKAVPIAAMGKQLGDVLYIFAVGMRNESTTATVTLKQEVHREVHVIGEDRVLRTNGVNFSDTFAPWDVHLYKLRLKK